MFYFNNLHIIRGLRRGRKLVRNNLQITQKRTSKRWREMQIFYDLHLFCIFRFHLCSCNKIDQGSLIFVRKRILHPLNNETNCYSSLCWIDVAGLNNDTSVNSVASCQPSAMFAYVCCQIKYCHIEDAKLVPKTIYYYYFK